MDFVCIGLVAVFFVASLGLVHACAWLGAKAIESRVVMYAITAVIAATLLVYLVAALLKPEWFG